MKLEVLLEEQVLLDEKGFERIVRVNAEDRSLLHNFIVIRVFFRLRRLLAIT